METNSGARGGDSSNEELETDADEDSGEVAYEERRDDDAPNSRSDFRQLWLILSFLFVIAAAVLLLLSHTDAAFVALALGVSAWFWNMRVRLKREHNIKSGRRAEPRSGDGK